MSQYDYEHQEQFDNSRHWQDEQPSASEAIDNSRFVDRLQEGQPANIVYSQVLEEFKIAAEGHAQNLQNSVLSIKHKTDHIRNELDSVQSVFNSVKAITRNKSRPRDEKYGQTSSSYSRSRYNPVNSKYMPSFDSKLEAYKKTAEDRKSQNRAGSTYGTRNYGDGSASLLKDKIRKLEQGFNNI